MVNFFIVAFLTGAVVSAANAPASAIPADSVGVVINNGDRLIRHQVTPKETIYSVARKYGVSVTKITRANPGLKTLVVGQIILVPAPVVAAGKAKKPLPVPSKITNNTTGPAQYDAQGNRVHKVDRQQTLFSIARLYGVSTADLKTWNKLPDDHVLVNQTLIVKRPVPPLPATAPINPVLPVKPESTATESAPLVAARPAVVRPDNTAVHREDTVRTTVPRVTVARVVESGLAELISKGAMSNKYLALHKTAPIGSFLTVRNLMNNQAVSVRVIGKLPDIGANEKVVVKVSKRAFQRLGALDNRFLVEVQYEVVDNTLSANQ